MAEPRSSAQVPRQQQDDAVSEEKQSKASKSSDKVPAADEDMARLNPISLNADSLEGMSFLDRYSKGDATITFMNESGDFQSVPNLAMFIIEDRCPLLAQAVEESKSGPQLHLEALTTSTVTPFLRFLYTGSYAANGGPRNIYADVPNSLLLHCQLFQLGDIYDSADLKSQAYINVLYQCEYACSSPEKPIDLCEAIKFVYKHLQEHPSLIDTIVNYCVSCCSLHQLAENADFQGVVYDLKSFYQDLYKESMGREFGSETTMAIIQMPSKPSVLDAHASREETSTIGIPATVFGSNADQQSRPEVEMEKMPEVSPKKLEVPSKSPERWLGGTISLAFRSKPEKGVDKVKDGAGEEEVALHTDGKKQDALGASLGQSSADDLDSGWDADFGLRPLSKPAEELVVVEHPHHGSDDGGSESEWLLVSK